MRLEPSELGDHPQTLAFTQQVFAPAFDFGRPDRTYLSHQFGEEAVQFFAAPNVHDLGYTRLPPQPKKPKKPRPPRWEST